nr:MAG TPA: hypothetical protein [Caudoviricetes sp.]
MLLAQLLQHFSRRLLITLQLLVPSRMLVTTFLITKLVTVFTICIILVLFLK